MKSIITASTYRWLSDSSASSMVFGESDQDFARTSIPLPAAIGDGWVTSMHLPLNVVVRRVTHSFNAEMTGRLVPVAHVVENMVEPVVCIQSLKNGRVAVSDARIGEELVFGPNGCLLQYTDRLDQIVKLDTSATIDAFIVVIGKSVLCELLGEEQATGLVKGLRIETVPSASVISVPRHISAILYASIPESLTGNIRNLFTQAKILEYISALAGHFTGIHEEYPLTPGKEKAIDQLRGELMRLNGKVPTLDQLGKRYGMSARLLNIEFKRLNNGQSIFSFLAEHRLKESHEVLLKTTLPMKTIAANLGYSHVNNFIIAFGKKFGYSPGSLRKKV